MVRCITYPDFANCSLGFAVTVPHFDNVALHCCRHRLIVCPERETPKKHLSALRLFQGITGEKQKSSSQNLFWNFEKSECGSWCRKSILLQKVRCAALPYEFQCPSTPS